MALLPSFSSSITPHSFIPGLKPSFSANPSHCSLFFSGLTPQISWTGSDTSELIRFYFLVFFLFPPIFRRNALNKTLIIQSSPLAATWQQAGLHIVLHPGC